MPADIQSSPPVVVASPAVSASPAAAAISKPQGQGAPQSPSAASDTAAGKPSSQSFGLILTQKVQTAKIAQIPHPVPIGTVSLKPAADTTAPKQSEAGQLASTQTTQSDTGLPGKSLTKGTDKGKISNLKPPGIPPVIVTLLPTEPLPQAVAPTTKPDGNTGDTVGNVMDTAPKGGELLPIQQYTPLSPSGVPEPRVHSTETVISFQDPAPQAPTLVGTPSVPQIQAQSTTPTLLPDNLPTTPTALSVSVPPQLASVNLTSQALQPPNVPLKITGSTADNQRGIRGKSAASAVTGNAAEAAGSALGSGSQLAGISSKGADSLSKSESKLNGSGSMTTTSAAGQPAAMLGQAAVNLQSSAPVTQLPAPDRAQMLHQVATGIETTAVAARTSLSGQQQVTIQLHPQDWGQVRVSVTMTPTTQTSGQSSTQITAHVVAENAIVKTTLEAHQPELRQALKDAGLNLDRLTVTVQPASAGTQAGLSSGHHGNSNSSWQGGSQNSGLAFGSQGGAFGGQNQPSGSAFANQTGVNRTPISHTIPEPTLPVDNLVAASAAIMGNGRFDTRA